MQKMCAQKAIFENASSRGLLIGATSSCEFVHLIIQAHGKIDKHSLNIPVNFFIIKGEAFVRVNNQQLTLKQGEILHLAPEEEREWENQSDAPLEILVIKELPKK